MKVWASIHKNNRIILRASAESQLSDTADALLEALEIIYKELDIAEPVWVSKHARELSKYQHTKFKPEDFLEPVSFDFLEIEFVVHPD